MLEVVSIVEREDERAVFFDSIWVDDFNQSKFIVGLLFVLKESSLVANVCCHIFGIKEVPRINGLLIR